jgi:hypothetical protein
MENVHIVLSLSIFVILVLLFSCTGKKRHVKSKAKRCASPSSASSSASSSAGGGWQISEDPMAPSRTGRGVIARQLAKQYSDLAGATYDDYSAMSQYMSLEPEVFASHDTYSKEMNRSTTGPSAMAERSDPNDVNPWTGLKRPDYSVPLSSNIRVEPTEFTDQMYSTTHYML